MKPKEGTPNKAKIKSAGRMLKNAGFNEIHLSAIDKRISLDSNYDIIKEIIEMSK